jgi:hypothetical protein
MWWERKQGEMLRKVLVSCRTIRPPPYLFSATIPSCAPLPSVYIFSPLHITVYPLGRSVECGRGKRPHHCVYQKT